MSPRGGIARTPMNQIQRTTGLLSISSRKSAPRKRTAASAPPSGTTLRRGGGFKGASPRAGRSCGRVCGRGAAGPAGWKPAGQLRANRHHRPSRHAMRYNEDLRTFSTSVLDRPISASKWSSSSRSCLYSYRRSNHRAIPVSHASGLFQDHPRSGNAGEVPSSVVAELQVVLPQDMFLLRNGAKQRLAAGAHRAVVNGPSDLRIISGFRTQATASARLNS
jgi:hypothetical protein